MNRKYLDPNIVNSLNNLQLKAECIVEGFMTGLHRSPFHGFSVEFSEHRSYTTGDETKNIDWKLWSKTDKYYIINDKLRITPEHLVFIKKNDNYEWFPAKNVKEGYEIFNSENEFETIKSIEMVEKSESVYNIKLQGIMNYYADTYLVHGSSKCDECENMK